MGIPWAVQDAVPADAAVGVGAVAGLLALAAGLVGNVVHREAPPLSTAHCTPDMKGFDHCRYEQAA